MSLKFQIQNTQAAIQAWATVDPGAVSYKLKFFRDAWLNCWYRFTVPPSCDSAGCLAGHLPYFAHFSGLGVRAGKDGAPFLESQPGLSDQELSAYLCGNRYLFAPQRQSELGSAHEAVASRLQYNLERLLELERNEDDQTRNLK